MRKLKGITLFQITRYDAEVEIPDEITTLEEAKKYADDHIECIECDDCSEEVVDNFLKEDSFKDAWIELEGIDLDIIKEGIRKGIITIEAKDEGIVAWIGDGFFYFTNEMQAMTVEELHDRYSGHQIATMICSVINSEPIKGATEEDSAEFLYYRSYLESMLDKSKTEATN